MAFHWPSRWLLDVIPQRSLTYPQERPIARCGIQALRSSLGASLGQAHRAYRKRALSATLRACSFKSERLHRTHASLPPLLHTLRDIIVDARIFPRISVGTGFSCWWLVASARPRLRWQHSATASDPHATLTGCVSCTAAARRSTSGSRCSAPESCEPVRLNGCFKKNWARFVKELGQNRGQE